MWLIRQKSIQRDWKSFSIQFIPGRRRGWKGLLILQNCHHGPQQLLLLLPSQGDQSTISYWNLPAQVGVIIISVLYLIVGLVLTIQSTYNAAIEDDSSSYIVNTEIKILDSNLESVRTFWNWLVFTKRSKPQVSVAKSWLKAFDYSCIVFGVASVVTGDPLW